MSCPEGEDPSGECAGEVFAQCGDGMTISFLARRIVEGSSCDEVTYNCAMTGTGLQTITADEFDVCFALLESLIPLVCDPGFDDCNDDPADGCETNIATDTNNYNSASRPFYAEKCLCL